VPTKDFAVDRPGFGMWYRFSYTPADRNPFNIYLNGALVGVASFRAVPMIGSGSAPIGSRNRAISTSSRETCWETRWEWRRSTTLRSRPGCSSAPMCSGSAPGSGRVRMLWFSEPDSTCGSDATTSDAWGQRMWPPARDALDAARSCRGGNLRDACRYNDSRSFRDNAQPCWPHHIRRNWLGPSARSPNRPKPPTGDRRRPQLKGLRP